MRFLLTISLIAISANVSFGQFTPNCTDISSNIIYLAPLNQIQINDINQQQQSQFPNVVKLGEPTSSYNCHNYAFVKSEGGAEFWLNDPGDDAFWNDGSYVATTNTSQANLKVSYQGDHTAVTTSTSNQAISKWGAWGLYRHNITDVPIPYLPNNPLTYYKRNVATISGPDLLCSPGTYTLQNLPAGSTATWSVIPASQFVNGSGTGTSAFMELSGNYTGIRAPRIVFTISTDCGDIQVDKTFWIGPPQLTYHPPGIDPCTANPYYSTISLPGFTYNWSVDNPNVWLTSNGQSITSVLSYNPEYFNITLEISDGNCTTSRTISSYTAGYYCQCFSDPACGNELALKVYPNPAAEMITVELDTATVSSIDRGFAQYELKLYTTSGEELLSQPVSSAKTTLDVRSLKNGFYYIHLIHKDGILRRQIRIER